MAKGPNLRLGSKHLFRPNENSTNHWEHPTIDNTINLTLLDAIEQIAIVAKGSALCDEMFETIERPLNYLTQRLELNPREALLFTIFFNMFYDNQIGQEDIGRYLDISPLQLLRFMTNVDTLIARQLIKVGMNFNKKFYFVPATTINAIKQDYVPKIEPLSDLSIDEWFGELYSLIKERQSHDLCYESLCLEIGNLIATNGHLEFVKLLKAQNLSNDDTAIFLWCCSLLVNERENQIELSDLNDLFDHKSAMVKVKRQFRSGFSALILKELIQPITDNAVAHKDRYELSAKVTNIMMAGLDVDIEKDEIKNLTSHKTITFKQMYYNEQERAQIEQLTNLLQPERYNQICARLESMGMRKGFACLFFGAPGTGKTETVLQIARATGRDIMQVNISDIKSKWVGESEKNIKKIFSYYKSIVQEAKVAPILFFNEADAIINKRSENTQHAVDKMENSIQNIILQEIECLDGILIATTNLTQNMDKAFERRFLYKIEFTKPSMEAKSMIWRSMIPELSEANATTLAQKYDFSGGEIENIARKHIVEHIITGAPISMDELYRHCDSEYIGKPTIRRAIGF